METQRFTFELNPVIEKPKIIAGFIIDESFFKEALELAVKKYQSVKPLMDVVYKDSVVKHSNPFYVALINEVLRGDTS